MTDISKPSIVFDASGPVKGWHCLICDSWFFSQREDPALIPRMIHEPHCTLENIERRDDMFKCERNLQERNLTYTRAVQSSSRDRQAVHLSEEVGKLMIEVSRLISGRTENVEALTEELADVIICCDLIRNMFGIWPSEVNAMINKKMEKFDDQVCTALGLPDKPSNPRK